ncbi:MAG: ISKra4 family transposase [Proteobacteria bacterium]|nr:ISKra4 family transposase [Pseudomonadota bacterium]
MQSIEQTRREVERCFRAVLRTAERSGERDATAVEQALWASMLSLGAALMALFFALRMGRCWELGSRYRRGGREYEVVGFERTSIGTRFGKVELEQPVGRLLGDARAARDLPAQRQLGLMSGFTLPVVSTMARLCAQMAFEPARQLFEHVWRWRPSPRAVLRMVDALGTGARSFLEQAAAPVGDGEVLVVSVDGKGAPAISSKEYARRCRPRVKRKANARHRRRAKRNARPRGRRGPGNKSKNAKMAAVGVLYTLKRGADGKLDGPVHKRVYATFEGHRALFEWLVAEARKRGYGSKKFEKVLFVADGARVIWTLQQEFFADAETCLDFWHAVEKLWAAGKAVCRGTRRKRKALEAWVAEQKKRLRKGQLSKVLDELREHLEATAQTGPGNKFRREVLSSVLGHFEANAERMRYARLRRMDLDISSGVMEGAVRHLVGVRLDGPGMRWSRDRAEAVLHLRCVLINGMWADFERYLALRRLKLAPQPVPTRTHDAVPHKAA